MTVPYTYHEFEQLYARTIGRGARSVAICSPDGGAGVTTLAGILAQRAGAAGRSVLLVDLNLRSPALSERLGLLREDWMPDAHADALPVVRQAGSRIAVLAAPRESASLLRFREQAVLVAGISAWVERFDHVIVDTSPLNAVSFRNVTPEAVCAACDATLMVVLAGRTSEQGVRDAWSRLRDAGAAVSGSVINDWVNPRLADEIIRESRRLDPALPGMMARLRSYVRRSGFLNATL